MWNMNSGSSRTVLYKTSSCTGFCKIQGKKTHELDKYLVLTLLTDILLHGHTDVGNCPWKIHAQRPLGGTTGRSCGRRAQWMITRPLQRCALQEWGHIGPIFLGFFPFASRLVIPVFPLCPAHHQVIPQGQSNGASWPYIEPSKTIRQTDPFLYKLARIILLKQQELERRSKVGLSTWLCGSWLCPVMCMDQREEPGC